MADDVAATYGPEPMAKLTATSDGLLLESTRGNFRIPKAAVTNIGRGKLYPWFFSGVRIQHAVAAFPKALQFKPLGVPAAEVFNGLRSLGYPVK